MKRRYLALILLALLALALPLSGSAVVQVGSCGNSLTWKLTIDGTGVLTISGQGDMALGKQAKDRWPVSDVKKVIIEDGVTSICPSAFKGCSNLTSVTIPSSVTGIGGDAFYDCSSLKSVTIPDSVTAIGERVFDGCSSLTSVTIPSSLTTISFDTFGDCSSLTSVTIPEGVTTIGDSAFIHCTSLKKVTIPSSVTTIVGYAFKDCRSLTSVTLPNGITAIGAFTFADCKKLKSIKIPASVTRIGEEAFSGCGSLTSVTIPASVAEIEPLAFSGCKSLKSIRVEAGSLYYTDVDGVLYNKDVTELVSCPGAITSLSIPNGVTGISTSAFANCTKLASVTIPASITNLDLSGCAGLTSVTIPNGVTSLNLSGCTGLTSVTIPDSVTSLDLSDCTGLTKVTVPNGVTRIDYRAFSGCTSLTDVTIPSSVTEISIDAFSGCTSLKSVTIPRSITSIDSWVFENCSNLTSVTIPDSVLSIDEYAFYECSSLKSVTIPRSVTWIGWDAFSGCSNGLTISCYSESAAHTYAKENNIKVKFLDPKPAITAQPASITVNEGKTASFKVTANHAETYQWYYRKSTSDSWKKVTANSDAARLSFTAAAGDNNRQFRCLVKNIAGSVYSKAVTLTVHPKPVIKTQPKNATVNEGKTATFKVTASNAETYQWYYRKSASAKWAKVSSDGTAATLSFTAKAGQKGYQFRCLVKNGVSSVYSKAVTLTVNLLPAITAQPQDATVDEGKTVKFTVKASRADSYQWYYRKSASGKWQKVSGSSAAAALSFTAKANQNGNQFRCLVKNSVGAVYSNTVTLTVNPLPVITAQPQDAAVNAGETATFTVKATGADSCQWYYRTSASGKWQKVAENSAAATLNVTASAKQNGWQFRCLVKNAAGSIYSDIANLTVQ